MAVSHNYYEKAAYCWSEDSIRLISTASGIAKSLFFYVQEIGYFKTLVPYFTERENLDSYLLVYTLSGAGRLKYGGQTYFLPANSAFFLNCNFFHHYETVSKEPWEFLWIHFNGIQALGFYEEYCKNGFHIISSMDMDFAQATFRQLLSLHQKPDATTELLTNRLITSLLTEFLVDSFTNSAEAFQLPDFIRQARKYIDVHFREDFSLDSLSSTLGVSKYYLSREFKKYIGSTITEYTVNCRISYAKGQLRYSNLSVQEIALSCGMNNFSYFIRAFKQRENLTPTQYRRLWGS